MILYFQPRIIFWPVLPTMSLATVIPVNISPHNLGVVPADILDCSRILAVVMFGPCVLGPTCRKLVGRLVLHNIIWVDNYTTYYLTTRSALMRPERVAHKHIQDIWSEQWNHVSRWMMYSGSSSNQVQVGINYIFCEDGNSRAKCSTRNEIQPYCKVKVNAEC